MITVKKLASMTGKSSHYIKQQLGVFVIGNGFDRAIGRDITYNQFYESGLWPREEHMKCPMKEYLDNVHKQSEWFDFEVALSNYVDADNNLKRDIEKDVIFYQKLVEGMFRYASSKNIETIDVIKKYKGIQVKEVPLAYHVLETILLQPLYHIYSFNYTELDSLFDLIIKYNEKAKQVISNIKLEYIHGSLATHDIILGAQDRLTVNGMELMRKTNLLKNTKIIADLENANQVVFFGHSLSVVDRCYFDAFFKRIKEGNSVCRSVIIFTKDERSSFCIKENLKRFYDIDWKCPVIEYFTIDDYVKQVSKDDRLLILNKIERLAL